MSHLQEANASHSKDSWLQLLCFINLNHVYRQSLHCLPQVEGILYYGHARATHSLFPVL